MAERILISGVNWLGDSIMTMPAMQALRRGRPDCRIVLLVKEPLRALWSMHAAVDAVIPLRSGLWGILNARSAVCREAVSAAFIFPNSVRSALVPFVAGISVRRGFRGHSRSWLLSEVATLDARSGSVHQAWEYFDILGMPRPASLEAPRLAIPEDVEARLRKEWGLATGESCIGMLPGAAFGDAKRWPGDRFAAAGRILTKKTGARILVFGSGAERDLCDDVAKGIGARAMSLGGRTRIPELAAGLRLCRTVVSNDNGGMHLASAVGCRLVAIFGTTDPTVTGPLGTGHAILQDATGGIGRDLSRNSVEARESLRRIPVERVVDAVLRNPVER